MRKTIFIVGGGSLKNSLEFIKKHCSKDTFFVGVDKGALWLLNNKLPLNLAIGDFDSISKKSLNNIRKKCCVIKVKQEKDDTDMQLAIYEIEKLFGNTNINVYIFGATGKRACHFLSNIYSIAQTQINITILDNHNKIFMLKPGSYLLKKDKRYSYISFIIISFVKNLAIKGFKYEFQGSNVNTQAFISNEFIKDTASIQFSEGLVLAIYSKD